MRLVRLVSIEFALWALSFSINLARRTAWFATVNPSRPLLSCEPSDFKEWIWQVSTMQKTFICVSYLWSDGPWRQVRVSNIYLSYKILWFIIHPDRNSSGVHPLGLWPAQKSGVTLHAGESWKFACLGRSERSGTHETWRDVNLWQKRRIHVAQLKEHKQP